MKKLFLFTALLISSMPVVSDDTLPSSFDIGMGSIKVENFINNDDTTMLSVDLGLDYFFDKNIYGFIDSDSFSKTINDVDISISLTEIGVGYESIVSNSLKLKIGVSLSSASVEGCQSSTCIEINDDGFGFVVGLKFNISESASIYAKLKKSSFDDFDDADRKEVGFVHSFSVKNSIYFEVGSFDGDIYKHIGYRRNF